MDWAQILVSIFGAIMGSSALWTYLQKKADRNDASKQLLIGLAHDRIMFLGKTYLDRGWIRIGEYEDLNKYLYQPYRAAGGNGTAEHIMEKVEQLPMKPDTYEEDEEE